MFGEKKAEIARLTAENEAKNERLQQIEPYVSDAEAIYLEVTKLLSASVTNDPDLVDRAVARVRERAVTKAMNAFVDDNVDDLLEIAIERIIESDGDRLFAEAQRQVVSDPGLEIDIQHKAYEIAAEEALATAIEQKAVDFMPFFEKEKKRQLALNQYSRQLQMEGFLNLANPPLIELLEHGDRMKLLVKDDEKKVQSVTMKWYELSENEQGWMYEDASFNLVSAYGKPLDLDDSTTLSIVGHGKGSKEESFEMNKIIIDCPVSFYGRDRSKMYNTTYSVYRQSKVSERIKILGCEFDTKEIFTGIMPKGLKIRAELSRQALRDDHYDIEQG